MMRPRVLRAWSCVLVVVLCSCGSNTETETENSAASGKPAKPAADAAPARTMDVGPVGKSLDPLDNGRIVVSIPKNWNSNRRAPKEESGPTQTLAAMAASESLPYPNILVKASDYKSLKQVTDANLEDFADQRRDAINADLEKIGKKTGKKPPKLLGEVVPIKLQSFRGVEYMKRGRRAGTEQSLEVLYLETVVDNRLYTIELQVLPPRLSEFRACALAVATSAKFPKAKAAPAE